MRSAIEPVTIQFRRVDRNAQTIAARQFDDTPVYFNGLLNEIVREVRIRHQAGREGLDPPRLIEQGVELRRFGDIAA